MIYAETDMTFYNFDENSKVEIREIQNGMSMKNMARISKQMNIKLSYKSMCPIGTGESHKDNITKTYVYGVRYKYNQWVKIYRVQESECMSVLESEMLFEVYFQKKAFELNSVCGFIVIVR